MMTHAKRVLRARMVALLLVAAASFAVATPAPGYLYVDGYLYIDRTLVGGPLRLAEGEKIRIGFVLPAIDQFKARLRLVDGQGLEVFATDLTPPPGQASFFDVFYEVTLVKGGILRVTDAASGQLIKEVPNSAGIIAILIGLLLPAVQGPPDPLLWAYGASLQLFDAQNQTVGILPFIDQGSPFFRRR